MRQRDRFDCVSGERPPPIGSWIVVTGWAGEPARSRLPGLPRFGALRLACWGLIARSGRRAAPAAIGPIAAQGFRGDLSLLVALATGDRSRMSPETMALFRRTGTAHVLAVSGLHVGLVGAGVAGVLMFLLKLVAITVRRGLNPGLAWVGGALAAGGYASQVGWTASASRAALMFGVAAALLSMGRRPRGSRVLLVAAVTLTCADPGVVATAAFQLSFGATLALFTVYPLMKGWVDAARPRGVRYLLRSFAITVAATLGTLPAISWWFQDLSVWSPVANLVAVPLVAWVLVPSALWLVYGPPFASAVVVKLSGYAEELLTHFLGYLPEAALHPAVGPLGAALLVLPLLFPRRLDLWIVVGGLCFGLRERSTQLEIEILDVGQGSAALIHFPGQAPILVDGGPPGRQLLHYLRRRGIYRLQAIVASHGDLDHVGGLEGVVEALEIGELWVGGDGAPGLEATAKLRGVPVLGCAELLERPLGVTLWCDPSASTPNDGSLVLLAGGVLLPGDLSAAGESRLLASGLSEVEVLILPHHGSRFSSSSDLLTTVSPVIGIASAGRNSVYGHPHPEVKSRLEGLEIPLLTTATHGSIQLRPGPNLTLRYNQPGFGWSPWLSPDELQLDGRRKRTPRRLAWPGGWRSPGSS